MGPTKWSGYIKIWVEVDVEGKIEQQWYSESALFDMLNALTGSAPIGMAILDKDLRFVKINQALATINGRTIEHHLGKKVDEALPNLPSFVLDIMQRVLETGESALNVDITGRRHSNPYIAAYALANYYPLCNDSGELIGLGLTVLDITDRWRIQEGQEIQALTGDILNTSLELDTNLQKLVRAYVPRLADGCYTLISAQETLSPGASAEYPYLLALAHADPVKEQIIYKALNKYPPHPSGGIGLAQVINTGEPVFLPVVTDEMYRKGARDEEHYQVLTSLNISSYLAIPLKTREHAFGALVMTRDKAGYPFEDWHYELAKELGRRISLIIDNIRLYRQAQQAIKIRDDFLSVAAHELKTPITSLRGFAQILLQRFDKDGTVDLPRMVKSLNIINRQADRLSRLVYQLLDISQIEERRLVLDSRPTDLVNLLQDITGSLQSSTPRHTIMLDLQVEPPLIETLDPIRLEQVVFNLLDNAIRFTPDNTEIRVELGTLPGEDDEKIVLTVADQGGGIAPQHRPYIFDRFYQVQDNERQSGLGLGLHVSKQIIEQHNGVIRAEFPESGGSRFIVELPRQKQTAVIS
jgi:PAS domain S-box-containing protein